MIKIKIKHRQYPLSHVWNISSGQPIRLTYYPEIDKYISDMAAESWPEIIKDRRFGKTIEECLSDNDYYFTLESAIEELRRRVR